MAESNFLKSAMLALSKLRLVRIFRNNTGTGWQGRAQWEGQTKLILHNPRPLHAGLVKGSSDLIGWVTVEVTPEMVGKNVAIFLAIEYKTSGVTTTTEQSNFIKQVREAGGRAGIARNEVEAVNIATQATL